MEHVLLRAIKELNLKTKNWKELTDDPFTRNNPITIQALDSRVLLDFDHVKNSLKLNHEGGGSNKAQGERAVALAAILSARSRIKEDSKASTNGEFKTTQSYNIVDAALASVHGRSAEFSNYPSLPLKTDVNE